MSFEGQVNFFTFSLGCILNSSSFFLRRFLKNSQKLRGNVVLSTEPSTDLTKSVATSLPLNMTTNTISLAPREPYRPWYVSLRIVLQRWILWSVLCSYQDVRRIYLDHIYPVGLSVTTTQRDAETLSQRKDCNGQSPCATYYLSEMTQIPN